MVTIHTGRLAPVPQHMMTIALLRASFLLHTAAPLTAGAAKNPTAPSNGLREVDDVTNAKTIPTTGIPSGDYTKYIHTRWSAPVPTPIRYLRCSCLQRYSCCSLQRVQRNSPTKRQFAQGRRRDQRQGMNGRRIVNHC